jgi:uncharacterized protein with HEPN domain
MPKDDRAYLGHMADAIARVGEFMTGVSDNEFRSKRMIQSAVVRELEIVGEAARNLSEGFRQEHPEIAWADVIAMRNRLIHACFDVDLNVVLEVARDDLPRLETFVRHCLD